MIAEHFNIRENVIPTTTVNSDNVVTQSIDNFFHLLRKQ